MSGLISVEAKVDVATDVLLELIVLLVEKRVISLAEAKNIHKKIRKEYKKK